jgi:hypothetical protein
LFWCSSFFGCPGYIVPTGTGKILAKMKFGAEGQRKPRVKNGIYCIRHRIEYGSYGSDSEFGTLKCMFCFTPMNGRRQTASAGPQSANSGHAAKTSLG